MYVGQKVPEIIRYVQLRLSFICAYSFGTILSLAEFWKREGRAGPPPSCSNQMRLSLTLHLLLSDWFNKHIIRQDIYLHLVQERSRCRNGTFNVHIQ